MSCDDLALTEQPQPVSGGWRCRAAQALLVLTARSPVDGSRATPTEERTDMKTGSPALAANIARQFQLETGYASSAVALTAEAGDKHALARLLAQGGSSAAVLLMDEEVIGRLYPPCDWMTPLLRVRNHLADEGSKFFVALTIPPKEKGILAALRRLRARFVARRVERLCNRDGVGFLGTVNVLPRQVIAPRTSLFHERVAAAIAHRLASATFFCCDAFRIGGDGPHSSSQYRGTVS
ncbi:hypothetical protein [Caballeronia novacaledonica]|uniref:Uncharacterized protein n=1 Tax=Caballeronia novacaledonica TaxID=1544861 RepID=A0AA37IFL9_9BURK|nr:hypothetical protein [Caballeronia novacaledonica]GJH25856.1 hypothetical protein CBA19CS42_15090 [Caballeronia novacaledonica]